MRQVTGRLGEALGFSIRVMPVPRIALRAMGVFQPLVREVVEMAYQWDAPYLVDGSRFSRAFGGDVTAMGEMVKETARWAEGVYGRGVRAAQVGGLPLPSRPGRAVRILRGRGRGRWRA
jgi:hypothetical protein